MSGTSHYRTIALDDKVAIVSGASRGIGAEAAKRLAALGARVVLTGTSAERLEAVANEIARAGGDARWTTGDVSAPDTAKAVVSLARSAFGRPDILINNAGINMRTATLETDAADWARMLDVNLTGTFHMCRAVIPDMIAKGGGTIVNVSSVAAKTPHANASPAYGVSKAGVNALTQHLALEFAGHGIRVNAVCPGPIDTDMTSDWTDAYREKVLAKVPLGRLGTAREIADAIVFLATPMSGFITGETLNANGGTYMN